MAEDYGDAIRKGVSVMVKNRHQRRREAKLAKLQQSGPARLDKCEARRLNNQRLKKFRATMKRRGC